MKLSAFRFFGVVEYSLMVQFHVVVVAEMSVAETGGWEDDILKKFGEHKSTIGASCTSELQNGATLRTTCSGMHALDFGRGLSESCWWQRKYVSRPGGKNDNLE